MRAFLFVSSCFSLAFACGSSGSPPVDAGTDAPLPSCEPDCEALDFTVEARGNGETVVPVTEGAELPWVWGFQGGTMIQPTVVLAPGGPVAPDEEVVATFRHSPDPADPGSFGQVAEFPELSIRLPVLADGMGRLVVGPAPDQLGWTELDGVRMILEVEVRAGTAVGTMRAAVSLVGSAPEHPACAPFPEIMTGCTYRSIAGVIVLETVDPATGACASPIRAAGSFEPEMEAGSECLVSLGADPGPDLSIVFSGDCAAAAALAPGGSIPGDLWQIERGSCSPQIFMISDAALSGCTTGC